MDMLVTLDAMEVKVGLNNQDWISMSHLVKSETNLLIRSVIMDQI